MKLGERAQRAMKKFEKYQYIFLVALVGVLLLLWPAGEAEGESQTTLPAAGEEELFQTDSLERRLEQALSRVEGAGQVTVVLTLREGPRRVLAQDGSATEGESQTSRSTSTVMASRGSGTQEPVELQSVGPVYQGALVVASGGDVPQVRLALSQAVSALTGLGADKITICKGK